jgi:hypothetical protein
MFGGRSPYERCPESGAAAADRGIGTVPSLWVPRSISPPVDIEVFVAPDYADRSRLKQALALMNGVQVEFRFVSRQVDQYVIETVGPRMTVEPALAVVEGLGSLPNGIWVTELPFEDNWFMHESRGFAVVSTADWEHRFAPPSLRAYLIYQMVQACATFAGDLSEAMLVNFSHEPPRGCMHDMCMDKTAIRLGMVAGALCAECVAILKQYGVSDEQIAAMRRRLELVRREALGMPRPFDPMAAFVVMRFSEFDENANAYEYGVKAGIEQAGLACQRADDSYSAGPLLTKVMSYIERARVVVVKVDHPNLNVYYELGAAQAMGKDLVLVAAGDLIGQLPTDISNIECVTYTQGDYKRLAAGVHRALTPLLAPE